MKRAAALAAAMLVALSPPAGATRIKDVVAVTGVRSNQLLGYGLVIGLNGTGDSLRNSPFTEQSLQSMLDRMGINVRTVKPRTRNVAAVIVTAELPAFVNRGSRIDITASSLGDATSLAGGTLVLTPLSGPDNRIYAVAQGQLAASGFAQKGNAETLTQGVPTSGRIPNGAVVERETPGSFEDKPGSATQPSSDDFLPPSAGGQNLQSSGGGQNLPSSGGGGQDLKNAFREGEPTNIIPAKRKTPAGFMDERALAAEARKRELRGDFGEERTIALELRNPDFSTAVRVADAINKYTRQHYGVDTARERDLRTVFLTKPRNVGAARFLAEVTELAIDPDVPARVVIDDRTGTIVIGRDVQISTVAVAHGSLTVRVTESASVSQPQAFADGETVVVPETVITADQEGGKVSVMGGSNLQTLVGGLNRMGLKPNSIIAILQAIKSAGALQADLIVQ
jgi:flagellar basal body P-ring protein FlgI